uniref:Uncharacterized protein n=1 Tax=Anopheles merus TaxID=30066 RepID=A0A182UVL7_ANOME
MRTAGWKLASSSRFSRASLRPRLFITETQTPLAGQTAHTEDGRDEQLRLPSSTAAPGPGYRPPSASAAYQRQPEPFAMVPYQLEVLALVAVLIGIIVNSYIVVIVILTKQVSFGCASSQCGTFGGFKF